MVHPSSAPGLPVAYGVPGHSVRSTGTYIGTYHGPLSVDSLVLQFVGVACCELPRDKLILLVLDGGEAEWREGKRKKKASCTLYRVHTEYLQTT